MRLVPEPNRRLRLRPPARKEVPAMNDFGKLLLFLLAVYGAYQAIKTAWRLGNDLFG